jgi:hypothetical protein
MQSYSTTPAECLLQRLLQMPKVKDAYQCFLEKKPEHTFVHVHYTNHPTVSPQLQKD